MREALLALVVLGCAAPAPATRAQEVVSALADDNYVWSLREPDLVALKLKKMQRGAFTWLRGTANVFWRDLTAPGAQRAASAFGDPASSRVLLVGDPHPENIGTFRAGDGTMIVEWNDFDAAGYGPFEGDVRRLATGLTIAADEAPGSGDPLDLPRSVARGYAAEIAALANGVPPAPVVHGDDAVLDKVIDKALARGAAHSERQDIMAFGDLDPVGTDGVIENRQVPVGAEAAAWIDEAIAAWRTHHPDAGAIVWRTRRIGSGVASYAALRYEVLLDDGLVLELKETRDGVVIPGVPQREVAEWTSPAARAVDAQRRLQARRDADLRLGAASIGGLALKIRDRTSYQRGLDAGDLAALAAGSSGDRARLVLLAEHLGGLLARAHGAATTADGVLGWTVIAPLLAGREAGFVDEVAALSAADTAQLRADYAALADVDLGALVIPEGR